MSHYIHVETSEGVELEAYLNISGDLSKFYELLDATEFDRGICGDGNKQVERKTLSEILNKCNGPSAISEFLDDVLCESESEIFTFYFS